MSTHIGKNDVRVKIGGPSRYWWTGKEQAYLSQPRMGTHEKLKKKQQEKRVDGTSGSHF
jgi:hypothetical protein